MSSEGATPDPAPVEATPAEKSEKQLKRESEKRAKKDAETAKKLAKLEARQVRGQPGNAITVGVVPDPPVELEPPSGTRVRAGWRPGVESRKTHVCRTVMTVKAPPPRPTRRGCIRPGSPKR
jgi:hypothetical protein